MFVCKTLSPSLGYKRKARPACLAIPDSLNRGETDMRTLLAFVAIAFLITISRAGDAPSAWPQSRGPNGSGVAAGQKPPIQFVPDKNLKWKVPVPSGFSSPIVAGDKLVLTAFEN